MRALERLACVVVVVSAACGSGDVSGSGAGGAASIAQSGAGVGPGSGPASGAVGATSGTVTSSGAAMSAVSSGASATGAAASSSSVTTSVGSGAMLPGGVPPFGGTSNGAGGPAPVHWDTPGQPQATAGGVSYYVVVPDSYKGAPTPFYLFYAGLGGAQMMIQTLDWGGPVTGTDDFIRVAIEHTTTPDEAGAVIDEIRAKYNVDNDRTSLISESAGTINGMQLGFDLRQGWFAAYWANDLVTSGAPVKTAQDLAFQPWGNAGPGGDFGDAMIVVQNMATAGYRLGNPAPYDGPGADMHGSSAQGTAAIAFLSDKSRQ